MGYIRSHPLSLPASLPLFPRPRRYRGITVLRKGPVDVVTDGDVAVIVTHPGAPRRCGGLGDVLSGLCGAFAVWAHPKEAGAAAGGKREASDGAGEAKAPAVGPSAGSDAAVLPPMVLTGVAASLAGRLAAQEAFRHAEFAMTASDSVGSLGRARALLHVGRPRYGVLEASKM